jgi:hypothetical protein
MHASGPSPDWNSAPIGCACYFLNHNLWLSAHRSRRVSGLTGVSSEILQRKRGRGPFFFDFRKRKSPARSRRQPLASVVRNKRATAHDRLLCPRPRRLAGPNPRGTPVDAFRPNGFGAQDSRSHLRAVAPLRSVPQGTAPEGCRRVEGQSNARSGGRHVWCEMGHKLNGVGAAETLSRPEATGPGHRHSVSNTSCVAAVGSLVCWLDCVAPEVRTLTLLLGPTSYVIGLFLHEATGSRS